jgi:FSR family fosmidomycin resistance protein-like MFS transporter
MHLNQTAAGSAAFSNDSSPSADANRGDIGLYLSVVVTHMLVDFMGMSVWPVYKTLAGLDVTKAGWMATVIAMSGTAIQPVFGAISDHLGPRRIILLGAFLVSFAMLLGPLTDYQETLTRALPTLFGFNGFYLVVFIVLAAGRLGQDMFHPAGAAITGRFSVHHGSTSLAVFIAAGSIGFGLSQISFRTVYLSLGRHTEIFLIPAAFLWALAWLKCRPTEVPYSRRGSVRSSLRDLCPVAGPIFALFLLLAISSGVLNALFFLMPEFAHQKGYPAWLGQGGAFALIILGATVFMVPIGHLADRLGRRRMLIMTTILSVLCYHAIVRLTLPVTPFIALCIISGAFLGSVNPLGVALGQQIAPRKNIGVVSAILMGWAWCLGATAPSITGELYQSLNKDASKTLLIVGSANLVMVLMAFLLPKGQDGNLRSTVNI